MNEPAQACTHASTYLGIEFGHEAPILLPVRNKHKNKIKYTFRFLAMQSTNLALAW